MGGEVPANGLVIASAEELAARNPVEAGRVSPFRLHDDEVLRLRSVAIDAGEALREHSAPFPILVTVVAGRVRFDVEDVSYELAAGGMVRVDAGTVHAVHAHEPSRILIALVVGQKAGGDHERA